MSDITGREPGQPRYTSDSARGSRRRQGDEEAGNGAEVGCRIGLERVTVPAGERHEGLGWRGRVVQPPSVVDRHDLVVPGVQEQLGSGDPPDLLDRGIAAPGD